MRRCQCQEAYGTERAAGRILAVPPKASKRTPLLNPRASDKVVAQVGNLLFRKAASLRTPLSTGRKDYGDGLPIANRRYGRLPTCATPDGWTFATCSARSAGGQ